MSDQSPGGPADDLCRSRGGDREAFDRLFVQIEHELHALARALMREERVDHTLQPTALISEAYARMLGGEHMEWESELHFRRIAAKVMRQVLVDHARKHTSQKSGGDRRKRALESADLVTDPRDVDYLAVHEALEALTDIDPQRAEIMEMYYFGDLAVDQIARLVDLAPRTIDNRLRTGRNWLHDWLEEAARDHDGNGPAEPP